MIKADLISKISIRRNISLQEAEELTDDFIDILKETIMNGEEIELRGFGCFRIHERKERPGRNPKTGESFPIPAKRIVKFKPSINLTIEE